jgi:hypothetical protein
VASLRGRERVGALAIYSGVVTGGGSHGLVLGGLITQWLSVASLSQATGQHYVLAHGMSAAFGLAALFDVVTLLLAIFLFRADPRPAARAVAGGGPARVPATSAEPDHG